MFLCTPGGSVGAGSAFTGGVNRLPPVGLRLFSVGDTGALDGAVVEVVVVGVVVVVVLDGAGLSLLPHAAINVPSPISIAAGATARRRRRELRRESLMPFRSG